MKKMYFILSVVGLLAAGCSGSGDDIATELHNNPPPQPKCETPTSLSFKPLYNIFSWSSNTPQGTGYFEVQYGEQGFSLGNGTIAEVNNTSYSLPIFKGKKYDLYVRKNCGTVDGKSNWAGPITILSENTTACVKPDFVNYTTSTSSVYDPKFSATVSWDTDGLSVYEVYLGTSSTPPAPGNGDPISSGHSAVFINLDKTISYMFYVRKRCAGNTYTDVTSQVVKWN
ncbi:MULTISPECIES: hypothetical protein [unclassified Chryseobacterium]|uniref:hypothetical protein n=1 Tax=unclassified Chryseobacterium TaxID=2593645 RepID=UPI00100B0886|nr:MULTISPECIES: hypothetical protein [unclassified Chryseobacterium]